MSPYDFFPENRGNAGELKIYLEPAMRFSRHASNRARLAKITRDAIDAALRDATLVEVDPRENLIFEIVIDGKTVWAVVARDDPNYIITLIEKRER